MCISRLQFFEMWHCVIGWVFPNVSKDHDIFIMKVRWSFLGEFDPEDEALWYFKTMNKSVTSQKTWIFSSSSILRTLGHTNVYFIWNIVIFCDINWLIPWISYHLQQCWKPFSWLISFILWHMKVITMFMGSYLCSLLWATWIHSTPSSSFKIHFIATF